jgi:hypothetical protein
MLKKVNAFTNCLEHTEFDSVMYKLSEMASAWWTGMHVSSRCSKLDQDGFDSCYWLLITTSHEASTMAGAFHTAACSEVNEVDVLFR